MDYSQDEKKAINNISRPELPRRSPEEIRVLVEGLIQRMTVKELLGQLFLTAYSGEFAFGPEFETDDAVKLIKTGHAGSIIGTYDNDKAYMLQKMAVTQSPHGIPLLLANDIIHGCRTGFPVNLAMAGTFDPQLVESAARIIAYEAAHSGTSLTFSPMLDIVRDPRWGRVMESAGEDPYLASKMAEAYVKGFQQDDLASYDSVGACAKHYVAYGACEGGRDYNTVDISERTLRQVYLKPFAAAIDAGVVMVMSAFNVYDGVPITANKFLLRDILRDELGFTGVTISDYESTIEIIEHKIAAARSEAAEKCIRAGLDLEIISSSYLDHLEKKAAEEPEILSLIKEAAARVLTLKYRLGLFDNPYKNIYPDFTEYWLKPNFLEIALKTAEASLVLLKNKNVLPLAKTSKVALIGPFSNSHSVVGAWGGKARNEDTVSLMQGLENQGVDLVHALGSDLKQTSESQIQEALNVAMGADVIVLALGEHQHDSGEAASKTDIHLSTAQMELAKRLKALNKPIVAVVFAGRPLILEWFEENVEGILYAWFPGTMSGEAIARTLTGVNNPSGRLAMSFPRSIGQIPVYYNHLNTGRPPVDPKNHYTSRYLDSPNEPLYPFGYGLSYAEFEYQEFKISNSRLAPNDKLEISVRVRNNSDLEGSVLLQIYIEALNFSVSRPVNELKAFKKVVIPARAEQWVDLFLSYDDFAYWNLEGKNTPESRKYKVKVGNSSQEIYQAWLVETVLR